MKAKYRIVHDAYIGYEVQYKPSWLSGWKQCGLKGKSTNSHETIEEAEAFAKKHASIQRVAKYLGELP